MHRILKQFFYGSFYLAILSGLAFGIYFSVRPAPSCFDKKLNQGEVGVDCGGPNCVACAITRLKPIRAISPQFFEAAGRTTVLLEFQNSNTTYGAVSFDYEVALYDSSGGLIKTLKDSSFIYPGEVKLVVIPALEIETRRIARGEVKIWNPSWEIAEKMPRPLVETREVKIVPEIAGASVQGILRNGNPFGLSRANISAVVAGSAGFFINASHTFISDLKPFEERFFKVAIPLHEGVAEAIDPKRTMIFVEVIR